MQRTVGFICILVIVAMTAMQSTVAVLEAARLGGVSKVITGIPAALLYGEVTARDLPIKEGHINDSRTSEEVLARAAADIHGVYRDRHGALVTVRAKQEVLLCLNKIHSYGNSNKISSLKIFFPNEYLFHL